jgi:hypothetical protein
VPEKGDTVADLASMIGLNASAYQRWLTTDSGTAMPSSASQAMGGYEHFEIPNTVVAYWAGNLDGVGRFAGVEDPNLERRTLNSERAVPGSSCFCTQR